MNIIKTSIALLYGGKSSEHDVSVKTAFSILKEVDYAKHTVIPVFITKSGQWNTGNEITQKPSFTEDFLTNDVSQPLLDIFSFFKNQVDVAFPAMHGPNGEDGTIQGLLELIDIPYVGCGVLASSVGMDKVSMKHAFNQAGIPQCSYLTFSKEEFFASPDNLFTQVSTEIGFPCFVKPANMGSSVGITKANNLEELTKAIPFALEYDRKVVIEELVTGKEIEVGVLGNYTLKTSAIGEVSTTADFYDYEAKYKNQTVTNITIPAILPPEIEAEIHRFAKKAFKSIDGTGLSRVDFFYDAKKNNIWINEINTMPGFTPFSMYPLLFAEVGVNYPDLIEHLLSLAIERHQEKASRSLINVKQN